MFFLILNLLSYILKYNLQLQKLNVKKIFWKDLSSGISFLL